MDGPAGVSIRRGPARGFPGTDYDARTAAAAASWMGA